MKKIEKLTPEQIARFPEFRDEYLRRGLSTAPADRAEAEDAIRDAYRAGGMEPPRLFVWLLSPGAGAMGAAMLAWGLAGAEVGVQVRDQVGAQVGDQVGDEVRDQVGAQVGDQVGDQVWAQVGAQVGDQVRDQVGAQVGDQVGDQVRDQVGAQVYRAGYGQHDANWLAFYAFFADACGVTEALRLTPLNRLAAAAGWWWPFRNLCIVTDRPEELHRDEAKRLHSDTGPAIKYRDGWSVYSWHGYRLPVGKEWIIADPSRLSPNSIDAEENTEIRRIMLEVFGFEKYIQVRGARVVDEDEMFGRPRRLLEMKVRGESMRVMDVHNGSLEPDGTRRRFFLGVARHRRTGAVARTVSEAVANSYGIEPKAYAEAVRT